jgi:hypothetical protein
MDEQQQVGAAQSAHAVSSHSVTLTSGPSSFLQGNSSLPELPLDPELRQAITNITHWRAYTSGELGDLPQRSLDTCSDTIAFNHGLWTWLTSMTGNKPAGLLRPFTSEEQQALVEGHAVLSRRMGELQKFLVHLGELVGARTDQLQQASSALADTLNDNACLMATINSSKDTTQKYLTKLSQAAANLEVRLRAECMTHAGPRTCSSCVCTCVCTASSIQKLRATCIPSPQAP